jgi:hypothetical protein
MVNQATKTKESIVQDETSQADGCHPMHKFAEE